MNYNEEFKNTVPYPNKNDFIRIYAYKGLTAKTISVEEMKAYKSQKWLVVHCTDEDAYNKARKEYKEGESQSIKKFRAYLEQEFALSHVNQNRLYHLFAIAWDYGHSSGFNEVASYYEELHYLVK